MKFSEFLNESPLPDSWDKEKYKGRLDFKEMVRYASERAAILGKGSARIAFEIDFKSKNSALKIALNPAGIAQNIQEVKYLSDTHLQKLDIVIPIIDYDKENYKPRWIQVEIAKKITEDFFQEKYGHTLKEIVYYIYKDLNGKNPDVISIDQDDKLIKGLYDLIGNYKDLLYGDLARVDNWGLYDGRPVIIDIGFDAVSQKMQKLKKGA